MMDLDVEMASLELNERKRRFSAVKETPESQVEEQSDATESKTLRRSTRKRIRPIDVQNRRVYTKPKKFNANSMDIVAYYLNRKVKLVNTCLETIFEEPKTDEDVMSGRKLRRMINFSTNSGEKSKTKKRSMKAKKVCAAKYKKNKNKKVTKESFLQRMKVLEQMEEI